MMDLSQPINAEQFDGLGCEIAAWIQIIANFDKTNFQRGSDKFSLEEV